tara:strand:- start:59 stop:268 length:210 start_codon:yes stop_codon:yes gene_type:complete
MTKIYLNNKLVELTSEQEATRLAEVEAHKVAKKIQTDLATAKANNKKSGKQKLKDLGLDDEEINALIGN